MRRTASVPDEMGWEARMIASVHLADVGARSALAIPRKTPRPATTPGLRDATVALAAPLGGSTRPRPDLGRVGLIAFWDDDHALDEFEAADPLAARLAGGRPGRPQPPRARGGRQGVSHR